MKALNCDVAVIGGGPAGMAAAVKASENGAGVVIIERNKYLGGILNQCVHDGFGLRRFGESLTGPEYASVFVHRIEWDKRIAVITNTIVTELSTDKVLICVSREGILQINASAVVLATGCRERTRGAIGIPGTRPAGIYTAGVVQELLNIENIKPGGRAVILGSGDIGLIMARRLTLSGVEVVCVLEKLSRCGGLQRNLYQCLGDYNIPLELNKTVTNIFGARHLEAVEVSSVDNEGKPVPGSQYIIRCDTLVLSVGLIPESELARNAGIVIDAQTGGCKVSERLETSAGSIYCCGNSLHVSDLADKVSDEGDIAGEAAAARLK